MGGRRRIDWLGAACVMIIIAGCAAAVSLEQYGLIRMFAVAFPTALGAYAFWAWRQSR